MIDYSAESDIFKVLSVPVRLKILDMLSCSEICACELLKCLSISQSTLSHHMKVLINCGLVSERKEATWVFYSIRRDRVEKLHNFIDMLTNAKQGCICDFARMDCGESAV